MIRFEVIGKPEPAGSKRAFRNQHTGRVAVVDANRNAKPWQATVAAAGYDAMNGQTLLDGPVAVVMVFTVLRPKGHYGTGRNSGAVKGSAPEYPIGRPDVLKLARGVEDALTGVCWRDDAQIVDERLLKVYGEPAGVAVSVWQIMSFAAEVVSWNRVAA